MPVKEYLDKVVRTMKTQPQNSQGIGLHKNGMVVVVDYSWVEHKCLSSSLWRRQCHHIFQAQTASIGIYIASIGIYTALIEVYTALLGVYTAMIEVYTAMIGIYIYIPLMFESKPALLTFLDYLCQGVSAQQHKK